MAPPYGPLLSLGDHRIVIGVPGSGKTYHARSLVRAARRVVVFDPGTDWEGLPGAALMTPDRWDARVFKAKYFRVVVQAARDSRYDVAEEFAYTYDRCREIRDLVLVADEVRFYKRGAALRALGSVHMNGHKWGIVSILISQRAVGIPLDCRATATHVDSFLQDSEEDLAVLEECYDPGCPGFTDRVRHWQAHDPPVTWERRKLYR